MEGLEGRDEGWLGEELLLLKLLELLVQVALLLLMDLLLLLLFHLVLLVLLLLLLLLLLGGEADLVLLLVAVLLLKVEPLTQLPLLEFGLLPVDCGIGVDGGLRSREPSGRRRLGGPSLLRLLLERGGGREGVRIL